MPDEKMPLILRLFQAWLYVGKALYWCWCKVTGKAVEW